MILTVHPDVPAATIREALHTHGLEIKNNPDNTFSVVRAKCGYCDNPAVISERGKLMCPECYVAVQLNRW